MLLEHFNFGVQPFRVTPDPRFLYLSKTHREALASLHYGIHFGRGFTALIADPGMGKTTLLFSLLGLFKENSRTAFLFQTLCGPEEFLRALLADLDVKEHGGDVTSMHAALNSYLSTESKNGRQVIVVIDEAQNLDDGVLELVRMLSNFETPGKKLMQIVLSGQPQLAEKLSSERLTQLRQRISIVARLTPFNADETREYIEHRLRVAGATRDKPLFSKQAYAMIARESGGIPRNINNLCFNSMSLACALGQREVDSSMVQESIDDLDLTTIARSRDEAVQSHSRPPVFESAAARFMSWRSAVAVLGIGLLMFPAFLAHRHSINDPILQQPAAIPERVTGSGSEVHHAPNVFAQPEAKDQPQKPRGKLRTQSGLPTSTSRVSGKRAPVHVDNARTEVDSVGPLPPDLKRLQQTWSVDLSRNSQVHETKQTAAEQKPVPFETAAQREKP